MSYNKDTDYQAKIDDAVSKGDYESAAKYEKSRNEKIDGENLNYKKTNNYSGWLDTTDYSNVLRDQMSSNASKKSVANTLKKRVEKASGTQGLTQYAYDDVYDAAVKYIMGGSSFSFEKEAPAYSSKYDDEIRKLYDSLSKLKKFSYDPYSDDMYKYYREQYLREGKRAMQDLLGELSMNTGGVASSYAVGAAAQSLDYYNSKLTDKIPELYNDAYERYLDEIGLKEKQLSLFTGLENDEYEKYLDKLKQYNSDREFSYKSYLDSLDEEYRREELEKKNESEEREYDYLFEKLGMEKEENERSWTQQEYENEYKAQKDRIEQALEKWKSLGYLDSESAEILGLPYGTHTSDYDYKKAQQYKIYNK